MKSLKVGDKVLVIAGDNKGKEAKIVAIDRAAGKACLEGIEVRERHMRKSYINPNGGKKTIHVGIELSNLKLVEASVYAKPASKKGDKKADKKVDKKAEKAEKKAEKKAKKGAK